MSAVQAIPLPQMNWCEGCQIVTDAQDCPLCLSRNLWPVQKWLDRGSKKQPKRAQ